MDAFNDFNFENIENFLHIDKMNNNKIKCKNTILIPDILFQDIEYILNDK